MTDTTEAEDLIRHDWFWYRRGSDDWRNPKVDDHHPGQVFVHRMMNGYRSTLDLFIEDLRELAVGLDDPEVMLVADPVDEVSEVYVCGYRAPTDFDRERLDAITARQTASERAQYEALRARFEGEGT